MNGVDATAARVGATVTFPATLQDNANTLSVSVQNPGQAAPATATATVTYPFMAFTNGQPASFAIGQPDMVSVMETADDKIVSDPYGRVVIVSGVLYVPDDALGRVMGYSEVPTASDASADFVLGKADFTDTTATASATTMGTPGTMATDGQRLFVTDFTHSRVLVFDTAPTTSGAPASYAIGQPELVTGAAACSATGLDHPESVTYAAGRLIVTDTYNSRVLIWNSVPDTFGVAPDVVLGQGSFTTCVADDDDQDGTRDATPSARVMDFPSDAWSDGERLVVTDSANNRVLIWNEFPTTNFAAADVVLGQPDFGSVSPGLGASGLEYPYYVHSNGNQLFVADAYNNRVLIWDSLPQANAQSADHVLGQFDFTTGTANSGDLSVNEIGFDNVTGVYVFGNQLFVSDNNNNRILVFDASAP